ncbi:MAG: hypothetical protein RIM72_16300 [Alphaproteobacteria bacterium]|jgi:hypothetical protein
MKFERQNCKPLENPSERMMALSLKRMRSTGPSAFGTLSDDDGNYLQFGGGPTLFLLERCDGDMIFRASQEEPVVAFEDGTTYHFAGNAIAMLRGDWFLRKQVVQALGAFSRREPLPSFISFRPAPGLFGEKIEPLWKRSHRD